MKQDEIMHYGTKGMKWGIRRYQNPDGSRTYEGKIHYGYKNVGDRLITESSERIRSARKSAKEGIEKALTYLNKARDATGREVAFNTRSGRRVLSRVSDEELKRRVDRLKLETDYRKYLGQLRGKTLSEKVKSNLIDGLSDLVKPKNISEFATTVLGLKLNSSKKKKENKESEKQADKDEVYETLKEEIQELKEMIDKS